MKQMSFADAEYTGKRKQTRRERFLIEMDQVVPWKGLIALIKPFYPKGDGGRPAYPLMVKLRAHLMQNWFGYSDPAMEESLYERTGFSHADQPVQRDQTFLNVLAPGVIQDHLSVGLTWRVTPGNELSLAYTHGFEQEVKGNVSIPAAFGGGEANLKMSQDILGVDYAKTF